MHRRNNILLIIMALGALLLTSCHKDDDKKKSKLADKTILMYMPYTGAHSLYSCFLQNIRDCERAIDAQNGLGNNRFVVFIAPRMTDAFLIDFKYDSKYRTVVRDTLKRYNNPVFESKEFIKEVITDAKIVAPAQHYGMCIESHGAGWLPADPNKPRKSRYFGASDVGCRTDVSTLINALDETNTHLQFMLFDDCYMACVENAYDFRNTADWYIASTSEVMDYGMPYQNILPVLLTKETVFSQVVNKFYDFYNRYTMPYGTICAAKLSEMDDFAEFIKTINQNYDASNVDISSVQDLDAGMYSPTIYFDMEDYYSKVITDEGTRLILHEYVERVVPYKAATEYILSARDNRTHPVKTFSGLTVSDPSTHIDAIETKMDTPWWKATH